MVQERQSFYKGLKTVWSLVSNILQIASALIGIATTSFVVSFFIGFLHRQDWIAPLRAFSLGIIVATLFMFGFYLLRTSILLKRSPSRWIIRSYTYMETESRYEIHENDPSHHTFTITTKIKATQSGVNIFENTYRWTGRGKEEIPKVVSPGHTLLGETINDSGWKYYYIHLGQPLNIGETAELKTVLELYDNEKKFDTYLAKIVSQPVEVLTLKVVFPLKTHLSKFTFTEWDAEGPSSRYIKQLEGQIDHQKGELILKIKKPVLHHRYEIRWHY